MPKCDPVLLAPAALGNPITAWARTRKEVVVCYASGLILSFPLDRSLKRPGRRLSIESQGVRRQAIELQSHDEEIIRAIQIDKDNNVSVVVGDTGMRVFSSNQRHLKPSISKFDLVHQPFTSLNTFVLSSEIEAIIVSAGGFEALIVNLSTRTQEKIPIAFPRQSVPIVFTSERFIWVTETRDPSSQQTESYLSISRFRIEERLLRFKLHQRAVNSPIDVLYHYVAYVFGKSKENIILVSISLDDEGRPRSANPVVKLWSARAHRHPVVALRLWLSPPLDIFLITVSESSCIKLWKDSVCLQIFRFSPVVSFSLGYPYSVLFDGRTISFGCDQGLFEIAIQI